MSFIEVSVDSDFPIENLPYGIFSTKDNVSQIFSIINLNKSYRQNQELVLQLGQKFWIYLLLNIYLMDHK
jgi:hypothetical protein